jgi:hypothetical protein
LGRFEETPVKLVQDMEQLNATLLNSTCRSLAREKGEGQGRLESTTAAPKLETDIKMHPE